MTFKLLTTFSLVGGLLGCSSLQPVASQGPQAPVPSASVSMVDNLYGLARQAHGSGHLGLAGARYERVLALQSDHLGALNGLGVIRAQDGRSPEAHALFQRVSALSPLSAHVHNNLAYMLLREHRLDEADTVLQRARALEPDSDQTLQNLARLAKARGQQADARDTMSESNGQGPAVVALAPNIFELRLPPADRPSVPTAAVAAVGPPAPAAPAAPSPAALASGVKLEISNGVGAPRLATRTARRLAALGVPASRLTNAPPYRQDQTRIQYLPGQEASVQALLSLLPVSVGQVEVATLGGRVDIRLVLGHDLAGHRIASWAAENETTQLAAPFPPGDGAGEQTSPAMANSRPS